MHTYPNFGDARHIFISCIEDMHGALKGKKKKHVLEEKEVLLIFSVQDISEE